MLTSTANCHDPTPPVGGRTGVIGSISRRISTVVAQRMFANKTILLSSGATSGNALRRSSARFHWPGWGSRRKQRGSTAMRTDLLDSLPIAVVAIDEQETIAYANKGAIELFGYQGRDMHGMPAGILFPATRADALPSIQRALTAGDDRERGAITVVARKADNAEFLVELTANACDIDKVHVQLIIVVDRSERYELHRSAQELAHLARISSLGEMAGSLAHELNQPLTAILSNAQAVQHFIEKDPINLREIRETLRDIVADNCRASEIIRRIRSLVRKGEVEIQSLDMGNLIREVVTLVHSDAIVRGIKTKIHIDDHLPPVRGDKVQLQQVLLNLLLNAFEAACDSPHSDRTVALDVIPDSGNTILIAVRDRGSGMTVDQLDTIFEPFVTSKQNGLGLGLSISRKIVLMHGGSIRAENNRDCGATFYVNLPAEGTAGYPPACGES
ncbi:PAS domain S-box protein [Paraburkholderia sp. LEh10]|uniref:two-component system sensor histidine kinase NtrB n=1 Tax=Paraburkholderia sp. LEh10 TaxID=2821353 RepID=UPI001AE7C416|nr:ATP-binding protein [Paraburkholderia sp. LEh10]MBP0590769.1 PAS domain S-box protein [Paraburkholderia sp. LEh10]